MTSKKKPENAKIEQTTQKQKFGAEVDKILQLMIHSVYANKDIFLRELISNASDALDKLRYEAIINTELASENFTPKISITANEKSHMLIVADNGIGMNEQDLIENLGTIARSGTQEFAKAISGNTKKDIELIGQFGVGFYSSFMVADKVEVFSRKAGEQETWQWSSSGDGEYTICKAGEKLPANGTKIILHIKKDAEEFLSKHRIQHIVKTYSNHISFPVEFSDNDNKPEIISSGTALWRQPKSKITNEEYTEFYHHVAHTGDEPWMILHNKSEGILEFTNLLFIPNHKPFDLFHPERLASVKLYVRKVFITESNIELIPRYLRFLKGVVDSEDLPLNISRETLQHNALIHKIKNAITKKVLDALAKKATEEPKEYLKFWQNFGAVLKEGLCESIDAKREEILQICLFKTTKSPDKFINLDEYIKNMPKGQKEIYYLVGDNLNTIKNSPQLEGFKSRDIEVLLLDQSVDSFWVNVVQEYKDKTLKSATNAGIELDKLQEKEDSKDKKDKNTETKTNEDVKTVLQLFKDTLGNKIKDVIESKKLTDSPACLSIPEGSMNSRMEKFLIDQNQLAGSLPKILEINTKNPLIQYIGKNKEKNDAKELIWLLFDEACIIEGEMIEDPSQFSKRINSFLEKMVA